MIVNRKVIAIVFLLLVILIGVIFSLPYLLGGLHSGCESCRRAHSDLVKLMKGVSSFSEVENSEIINIENFRGKKVDPWGNEYGYKVIDLNNYRCVVVWSFGADGVHGGNQDYDLDIFKVGECKLRS